MLENLYLMSVYTLKKNVIKEIIREKKSELKCMYRKKYQNMREKKHQWD